MAQSVASVHRGLARIGGRPWTGLDTRKLKRRIRAQVARLLEPRDIPRLVRRDLEAARASIRHIGVGGGGIVCPVHGDLHLGQILRSAGRYLVLDFEGEPLAGPEDRLAWHSPLKDVAGMLRSFDYAAAFGRREGAPGSPREWAAWVHQAEGVFLSAYWREMGDVISAATKARDNLLGLYLVEKATYEIAYELQSRPDWVDIPLGGLRRVLARAGPKS